MEGSLDTNAILRLVLGDIPEQQQLVIDLLDESSGKFAVSDIAMAEAAFVLARAYEMSREHIALILRGVMAMPNIETDVRLLEATLRMFETLPALSFEDCYMSAYAAQHGEPLYTFDRKLAHQAPNTRLLG